MERIYHPGLAENDGSGRHLPSVHTYIVTRRSSLVVVEEAESSILMKILVRGLAPVMQRTSFVLSYLTYLPRDAPTAGAGRSPERHLRYVWMYVPVYTHPILLARQRRTDEFTGQSLKYFKPLPYSTVNQGHVLALTATLTLRYGC